MPNRTMVLTDGQILLKMERMALEIAARIGHTKAKICLLGIQGNGWLLARKMAGYLHPLSAGVRTSMIALDKKNPLSARVEISEIGKQEVVIVCDDVTNSGRTLLYALKPLLRQPLTELITLVLVERMHNQFPVKPDFSGLKLATSPLDYITVEQDSNEFTSAWLESPEL